CFPLLLDYAYWLLFCWIGERWCRVFSGKGAPRLDIGGSIGTLWDCTQILGQNHLIRHR
ncbi:hypothetical protein Tsubulata_005864, partial [Turnera subulata]